MQSLDTQLALEKKKDNQSERKSKNIGKHNEFREKDEFLPALNGGRKKEVVKTTYRMGKRQIRRALI